MAARTGAEIKVGIFVIAALLALAYLSIRVGTGVFGVRGLKEYVILFDNASGLRSGARSRSPGSTSAQSRTSASSGAMRRL
jgi:ABC-type transporter Mla subunit MlaD